MIEGFVVRDTPLQRKFFISDRTPLEPKLGLHEPPARLDEATRR
jgi:hypothetical protein